MNIPALYTEAELLEEIAAYKKAAKAIASGQSYELAGRRVTKADLEQVQKHLEWLQQQMAQLYIGTGPQFIIGRPRRG